MPHGTGSRVTITTRMQPASFLKGLLMRLIARPRVNRNADRALDALTQIPA